jgi:hypothetical protein
MHFMRSMPGEPGEIGPDHSCEIEGIVLRMGPASSISGRVVDRSGKAVPGVLVYIGEMGFEAGDGRNDWGVPLGYVPESYQEITQISSVDLRGKVFARTDSKGYYKLSNLPNNWSDADLGVVADGYAEIEEKHLRFSDADRCNFVLFEAITATRDTAIDGHSELPMQKNLLLYYSFQGDTGERVTDISGKGKHGRVHGARYERDGAFGGAIGFDGLDDYISVPQVQLEKFTIAAWVKTSAGRGSVDNRRIFTLDDGVHFYGLQGNGRGGLSILCDSEEINEYHWRFESERWTHLTLTHEASSFKLYKDGKVTETGHMASSPVTDTLCIGGTARVPSSPVTGTLRIGGTAKDHGGFWQGMIDEVAVFNRALSETEVNQLYLMTGEMIERREATK